MMVHPASTDENGDSTARQPIKDPPLKPQTKRQRSRQSCEHCRKRKTRCVYSDSISRTCLRCLRENKRCEFSAERYKRRGSQFKIADTHAMDPSFHDNTATFDLSVEQQPNVLINLGQMDMQSPPVSHPPLQTNGEAPVLVAGHGGDETTNQAEKLPGLNAKSRLISTQLHNVADTLDLLTFAATEEQYFANSSHADVLGSESFRNGPRTDYDGLSTGVHESTATWKYYYLTRRGILSEDEAVQYVHFFFENLWPLKPVVPAYYADPSMFSTLATEEPVLMTAIITLASRYLQLPGHHGAIRSERIHWHAWQILKRNLQSAMWGSTCTRSLGTIASMLLLIDWHPKAINNPSTFADDDDTIELDRSHEVPEISTPVMEGNFTSKQRHGMMTLLENLNILSSAYRSNKVSWMLLSNAIALAQEGCCFEVDVETPRSTLSKAAEAKKNWNQTICAFIYLTDEHMALRLGLDPLLPEHSRRIVKDRFSKVFAGALPNSDLWESYFELTDEMRKVREMWHMSKRPGSRSYSRDMLAELEYVKRSFDRWKRQHIYVGLDKSSLLSACLSIEFNYLKIYSLSPAAYAHDLNADSVQRVPSASLREIAVQAARDMLDLVVNVLVSSGVLRVLPVRCWLFVTTAGLHLLKETISQNPNLTEAHPDVKLLRATVQALHQGSPDDIHTAVRFSRFFGVLLDAVLRQSSASSYTEGFTRPSNPPILDATDSVNFFQLSPGFDLAALPADLEQLCDSTAWWNETISLKRMA